MTDTTGHYRRLTGTLRMSGSSPLLEAGDSLFFRLVSSDDLSDYDGSPVIVEGTLSGIDRLQLEWIGRSAA
jgi:hypothetical protein